MKFLQEGRGMRMNIHEFGQENRECVLFLHAFCTGWYFYEESVQRLSEQYHVIVPAMPGHDLTTDEDYTSVEEIASELEQWLQERGLSRVHGLYVVLPLGRGCRRADHRIAFFNLLILSMLSNGFRRIGNDATVNGIGTSNKSLGAILLFIALYIGFGKYVKQENLLE